MDEKKIDPTVGPKVDHTLPKPTPPPTTKPVDPKPVDPGFGKPSVPNPFKPGEPTQLPAHDLPKRHKDDPDYPTQLPYPPGSGPKVPTEPSHWPEPSRPATKPDDPILENEGPVRPTQLPVKLRDGLPGDPFRPNPNPKPIPLPSPEWNVEKDGPQPMNPIANTGLIPREELPKGLLTNKNWTPKEVVPQNTTAIVDPADYAAVETAMNGRLESDIPLNDPYWSVLRSSKAKYYTTPVPPEPPPEEGGLTRSESRLH